MVSCLPGYTPEGEKRRKVTAAQLAEKLPFSKPEFTIAKKVRLGKMVASTDHTIRVAAAGNPELPIAGQWILADDPDYRVRGWVLRNPNVRRQVVEWIAENDDEPMNVAAAKNLLEQM